jgi:signal transduction histidine kinase
MNRPSEAAQALFAADGERLLANVQRLAGIGMLTAGISQELANLLSIVTTAGISLRHELQLQSGPLDETIEHYISLIERNAFRSARIVSLLQEYGSLEPPQMAITDIDTILRDALILVERQFREASNVRIAVSVPSESQSIVCDHNRIVQLLVNLLQNARDSMQESGGLVEIKVRLLTRGETTDVPEMNGRPQRDGDHIAISITDEGPGILPDLQEQLFKPFVSARPGGSGVGLGLSIANQIVQEHGGDIWFSNSRGPAEGASVTVVLPVRPVD